jgi:hypothetical protein
MVQAAADEAWRKARRGIDTGFGMAVGWVRERLRMLVHCGSRQPRWTLEAYKVGIHDLMASGQYTIGLGAMETFCSLLSSVFHGCKRRSRFFDVARGSALECASIHDILLSFQAIDSEPIRSRRKLSSTSTSTVRRGGLSTSTRKTDEKKTSDRMCSLQRPFFPLTLGTPF